MITLRLTGKYCSSKLWFICSVQGWMHLAHAVLCLRLTALCLLDVQHKVAQGQVGVSLIKSMCSVEAPLCNAIKQVYRPLLPTFFFTTFHLYDKMPSPWSEHNSLPTDSSRITTVGKRVRWEGMGGNIQAPQSHHGSHRLQSILSLTLLGRQTACNRVHADQLWERWGRGRTGSDGPSHGKKRHLIPQLLAPLTLPLNRWRQEGLAQAERFDWSVCCVSISFFVPVLTPMSRCFRGSCSRQFYYPCQMSSHLLWWSYITVSSEHDLQLSFLLTLSHAPLVKHVHWIVVTLISVTWRKYV